MKIKKVIFNNRKRSFEVHTFSQKVFDFPYSRLELIPTAGNRVVDAYPDRELGREGFEYVLADGEKDSVHLDAVLDYHQDPIYMKHIRLHNMTCKALELLDKRGVSKNELKRRMYCSSVQLNRLLDPAFYGKTTDQMIKLLRALDCEIELLFKEAS